MKNQLVSKNRRTTDVSVIVKDDARRAKLQTYIDEILIQKSKMLDAKLQIAAIRDAAVGELNIDAKMLNNLVSLFFNNNFQEKREEILELDAAISALMQVSPDISSHD